MRAKTPALTDPIMTKKQKFKRNGFTADFNSQEDDFILADLDKIWDEKEPHPEPLGHFHDDDEIIDSLLAHTDFNTADAQKEAVDTLGEHAVDAIDLGDDDLYTDQWANVGAITPETPSTETDDTQITEHDAINLLLEETGFAAANEPHLQQPEPHYLDVPDTQTPTPAASPNDPIADDSADLFSAFTPTHTDDTPLFADGHDELPPKANDSPASPANHYGNGAPKTKLVTYAALGVAIVALIASSALAALLYNAQTKLSKLTALVSILEEDMSNLSEKAAIAQPPQPVPNAVIPPPLSSSATTIANPEPPIAAPTAAPAAPQKPTVHTTKQRAQTPKSSPRPVVITKRLAPHNQPRLTPLPKSTRTTKKPSPTASWSVQLNSYKTFSDAKNKAAKLQQKGIPVKVFASKTQGYQLRAGNFQSLQQANSYLAKLKKSQRLTGTAVANR